MNPFSKLENELTAGQDRYGSKSPLSSKAMNAADECIGEIADGPDAAGYTLYKKAGGSFYLKDAGGSTIATGIASEAAAVNKARELALKYFLSKEGMKACGFESESEARDTARGFKLYK